MSRFLRKPYRLGIAANHFSLMQMEARSYRRVFLPGEFQFIGTPQALLSALGQLLEKHVSQGRTLDVTVADSWARYWMVEPPPNVANLAELRACAEERFQQIFGGRAIDWRIQADWCIDRPFLAAALPAWLCDGLSQAVRRHKVTLRTCQPLFIQQWHLLGRCAPNDAWLAIEQSSTLVTGLLLNGYLRHIRTLSLPARPADDHVLSALTREIVRVTAESPHAVPRTVLHLGPTQRWPVTITAGPLDVTSWTNGALTGQSLAPDEANQQFLDGDWLALAGHSS